MSKNLIVAIDGPAGSGKSTSAKLVAQKLGYLYIDTGAMYRAVTFLAIKNNLLDDKEIVALTESTDIKLIFDKGFTEVLVDGLDITDKIRTAEVNSKVSEISKIEGVRSALVRKQREYSLTNKGIVMEGRDIGTVVFPEADVKIFLTASLYQRAMRRAKEFEDNGIKIPIENVKENLIQRDRIDSTREISPLVKADDAVEIDTSAVTIDEQVELILIEVKKKFIKSS
ncbi:MAG TPA: (d)CMP kinase [Ignavibacteriaceae bacterium]|nr:(d)CMP kinase [Ignavibacteriaceae bacterium]